MVEEDFGFRFLLTKIFVASKLTEARDASLMPSGGQSGTLHYEPQLATE